MAPRTRLCLAFLALTAMASACLWDTDTLAQESKGKLNVLGAIVGRFDRNPPLYYEMRLERVTKEIAADPTKLDLYDDAGVACDRLGQQDAAIQWMQKKEAAMKVGNPTTDDKYRYQANLGTFYAHRWVANKSNYAKPEDLDKGIAHIRKAIEINPKAHFGREMYQLAILEWLRKKPTKDYIAVGRAQSPLGVYLESKNLLIYYGEQREAIEGLTGLVRLGNAWESVDVFVALAEALAAHEEGTTGEAALARMRELLAAGKNSAVTDWTPEENFELTGGPEPAIKKNAREEFQRLRAESDRWHEKRTQFMMAKLKAGSHPDTDPNFWDGYREEPLRVNDLSYIKTPKFQIGVMIAIAVLIVVTIPTTLIGGAIWWWRRKKRKA